MFGLKIYKREYFSLGSDAQLQVGEKINFIMWRFNG